MCIARRFLAEVLQRASISAIRCFESTHGVLEKQIIARAARIFAANPAKKLQECFVHCKAFSCRVAAKGPPIRQLDVLKAPQYTKEKRKAHLPSSHVSCLSQPWRPGPDGHCRYRKPCKLYGAGRARRTWGKQPRWEQTASSWSHDACRDGQRTLYT